MAKYIGAKTLEILEGADNYNAWIASKIKPYLKAPILEVGAGIGNISDYLVGKKHVVLTDKDVSFVKHLNKRFFKKSNVATETLDIEADFSKIQNKFNSIYSINVLEHIKDDAKVLQNINKLLNKNGRMVLLVPAKKNAFKKLDKQLGHFRRYEKQELKSKLEKAGFIVERIEFFNIIGLLSWVLRDLIDGKKDHLKPMHVKLFDYIVPLLRMIEPKSGLPIGISLIVVGKKI